MPLNTIPTGGIVDGQIIFATHSLAIIRALNGETAAYTIVASGSTYLLNAFITGSLFGTASWALNCLTASFADYATSASYAQTASYVISASYASQSQFSVTASNSRTASYYNEVDPIFVAKSASLATTGSNQFSGSQGITGSLTISGSVNFKFLPTGGQFTVTYDTASGQLFYTASNSVGGNTLPGGVNLQIQYNSQSTFAGAPALRYNPATGLTTIDSMQATGSFTGSFTGSHFGTSSWAISASVADTALTASYIITAQTSSYYNEVDPIFNSKSSSLATTGSNNFNGNQVITGSLIVSGSSTIIFRNLISQSRQYIVVYDTASGQLSYISSSSIASSGSSSPAGSDTMIQYNNNGVFGGATALKYNNGTGLTTIDLIQATGSFTGSFTGSLKGTASWAQNSVYADTAILALQANTASYISQSVESSSIAFGKGGGQLTSSAELTWNNLFPHFLGINSVSSSGVFISRDFGKSAGIILASNTGSLTGSFRWAHFIDNNDNYAFRRYDNTGSFIDNVAFFERLTARVNFSSLTGTGVRMVVADATGSLSTQAVPTGSVGSNTTKAGTASISSFGGTPLTSSVTFGTAFSDTNYSISVLGQKSDSRAWTIESQAVGNFVINSNSNSSISNPVFWIATPFNNS